MVFVDDKKWPAQFKLDMLKFRSPRFRMTYDGYDEELALAQALENSKHDGGPSSLEDLEEFEHLEQTPFFKLSISTEAMDVGSNDGIPPSGIRGNGNCSFNAVFLGYLAAYGEDAVFVSFQEFLHFLLKNVRQRPKDWITDYMEHEIQAALENKLETSQMIEHHYEIMAVLLEITIKVKVIGNNGNTSETIFNPTAPRNVYISTNGAHIDLYLRELPQTLIWKDAFHKMWTDPQHPKIKKGDFVPDLSQKEIWARL